MFDGQFSYGQPIQFENTIRRRAPRTYAFAQVATATASNTNTPNFGSLSIGAADVHRAVLFAMGFADGAVGSANFTDLVITVDGVETEYVDFRVSGSSDTRGGSFGAIWVPTGTTATIAASATFTGTVDSWALAVFRAVGLDSISPLTSAMGGSDDVTINTAGGKFVLLSSGDNSSGPGAYSGGGAATLSVSNGFGGAGYDPSPTGGSTTYDATNDTDRFCAVVFA